MKFLPFTENMLVCIPYLCINLFKGAMNESLVMSKTNYKCKAWIAKHMKKQETFYIMYLYLDVYRCSFVMSTFSDIISRLKELCFRDKLSIIDGMSSRFKRVAARVRFLIII